MWREALGRHDLDVEHFGRSSIDDDVEIFVVVHHGCRARAARFRPVFYGPCARPRTASTAVVAARAAIVALFSTARFLAPTR